MFADFVSWFGNLPLALQAVGYLLLSPFAAIVLGLLICWGEPSAGSVLEQHGVLKGLIVLGAVTAGYLSGIFGSAAAFYYLVYPHYALSVGVGLVFGLVAVPVILIKIADR